jgi:hypothetical protein
MKTVRLKTLYLSNAPLAIISILLGYSFWYIASYDHLMSMQLTIPLYFSDVCPQYTIEAPEKITVTLMAKRSDLYALDKASLGVHCDISKHLPGKHGIIIKEQHLFLPKNISLTHYKPANLYISIFER